MILCFFRVVSQKLNFNFGVKKTIDQTKSFIDINNMGSHYTTNFHRLTVLSAKYSHVIHKAWAYLDMNSSAMMMAAAISHTRKKCNIIILKHIKKIFFMLAVIRTMCFWGDFDLLENVTIFLNLKSRVLIFLGLTVPVVRLSENEKQYFREICLYDREIKK